MNNQTKKITTGAMMLAIIGALLLIDRALSYMFTEIILLMIPVVIIMYSSMYELRDGIIFTIALFIMGFVINPSISFLVYIIEGAVTGIGYSYGIKKNFDRKRLLMIAMFLYVVGEVLTIVIVSPILGFGGLNTYVEEFETMMSEYSTMIGQDISLETLGITSSTIVMLCAIMIIFTGILEGLLVHLLAIVMLKRFKIKDIMAGGVMTFNLSAPVAYVLMAGVMSYYLFYMRTDNETVKNVILACYLIGFMVLMYYGYIVGLAYIKVRYHGSKKSAVLYLVLCILLAPSSMYMLMIVGFLYGSGPLKKLLVIKGKQ